MKGFNKFFSASKKKLKISGNQDWDRRILNSKFNEVNFFLIHPDTLEAMEKGNPIFENRHFNLSPILSDKEFSEKGYECTYTPDCPLCMATQNREQFRSQIYDYIEDEFGVKDKKSEHPFYKEYQRWFLNTTNNAIMIKVLYFSPNSFSGMDKPETKLIRLTAGLLKKFEEMYAANDDLFETGEICARPIKLVTNGESGIDIRYEELSVIPEEKVTDQLKILVPDWSKVDIENDFQNFDVARIRPKSDVDTVKATFGEIKMYSNFEDLVDDIKLSMSKKDKHESLTQKAEKAPSKLSKFAPAKLDPTNVEDEVQEDEELAELEQVASELEEQDDDGLLIKFSDLKSPSSREHAVEMLQKFVDNAETIIQPKRPGKTLVNKVAKSIESDPKAGRMELLKFAGEKDILIDTVPF